MTLDVVYRNELVTFLPKIPKISIIGKGTAGLLTAVHFLRFYDLYNCKLEIIYDPDTNHLLDIGESVNAAVPAQLWGIGIDMSYADKLGFTPKFGIKYNDFGNKDFIHPFPTNVTSLHIDSHLFTKELLKILEQRGVEITEKKVTNYNDIDADYVIDCSGFPKDKKNITYTSYIPVNAAVITSENTISNDYYTHHTAMPYGWKWQIPLLDKISHGYLYNKDIDKPNIQGKVIEFDSYYREEMFDGRVLHNGLNGFFLEPMEGTALTVTENINRHLMDYIIYNRSVEEINANIVKHIKEVETTIVMHYLKGSKYDTPFWNMAQNLAIDNFKTIGDEFKNAVMSHYIDNCKCNDKPDAYGYGLWDYNSLRYNIEGLEITLSDI
tara:strand:+ start:2299 stop:3441 length:1143 start_codon:yes stop_codon:yes gene_type:complete